MALALYDTLRREQVVFEPLEPGHVRMYTCGPTVHDYAHIGNLRTFLFEDMLRRVLEARGYRVTQVMNLTDVDDKIIARRKPRANRSPSTRSGTPRPSSRISRPCEWSAPSTIRPRPGTSPRWLR